VVPRREKVLWLEIFKPRWDQSEYKGARDEPQAGHARRSKSWVGTRLIFQLFFPMKYFFVHHTYRRSAFFYLLHMCISAAVKEIADMINALPGTL